MGSTDPQGALISPQQVDEPRQVAGDTPGESQLSATGDGPLNLRILCPEQAGEHGLFNLGLKGAGRNEKAEPSLRRKMDASFMRPLARSLI